MTVKQLINGDGYATSQGLHVHAPACNLAPSQNLAAGQTIGDEFELGPHRTLNAVLETTVVDGTNPTLDVTVQTAPTALGPWRSVAAFDRQTAAGLTLPTAATEAGTTPPNVTIGGAPDRYINFRMECTTLGARGTFVVRYSIDGGVSWVSDVTPPDSAATTAVLDTDGNDTGATLAFQDADAAVDNVWTAKPVGYERKSFAGLDRFARFVSQVGGTSDPVFTSSVTGEAI